MTRDDIIRALIHFPVGLFVAWLTIVNTTAAILLGFGFLFYEAIEDWRIKDRSYKDVWGYLIGIGSGSFLFWLLF